MLFEVGSVCVKLAGRDAGKKCVVVDIIDNTYVLIDGETRRKKCNTHHLEPLKQSLSIEKGANAALVADAFKSIGIEIVQKTNSKKPLPRPKKVHVQKKASVKKK